MAVHTAVVLRAGGWHPGSVVGQADSPEQRADRLDAQAAALHTAPGAPDYVGIDNAAHTHSPDGHWELVGVDALSVARRVASAHRPRYTLVPTVTVADLDRAAALDIHEWAGDRLDLQVRVTNRYVGAGPMPTPTPPYLDLTDPEVLRGMDARFTAAENTLEQVRLTWSESADRPQPRLWALAHMSIPYRLAANSCDFVALTPADAAQAQAVLREVEDLESQRTSPLRKFFEVTVVLDDTAGAAAERMAELDRRATTPLRSDAAVFVGTAEELLARSREWLAAGFDGIRFRPAGDADVDRLAAGVLSRLSEN